MDTLLGTQTYVMDEIAKGLENDIHFFVILKGRQLGITTISLALDLYWQFTHPGWQGTLVSDTEENRDMFRSTLAMYMDGLPKEYKIPLVAHNRNQLVLKTVPVCSIKLLVTNLVLVKVKPLLICMVQKLLHGVTRKVLHL